MNSSEIASYRRKIQRFGDKTHTLAELQALLNEALNPPRKPYTRHKKKEDCNYKSRPVLVYSVDGRFIGEFLSVSEASRFTAVYSSLILRVLNKEIPSAKGYIFLDKSDVYESAVDEQFGPAQ